MKAEAFVTGIGQSQIGIGVGRSALRLTRDALAEALVDAGLSISQIDGVATYPGRADYLGFSPVGAPDVMDAFGLRARWYMGAAEVSSQLGAIAAAADAVKAGHARHVMCFRTVYEATARRRTIPKTATQPASGQSQWFSPFHALSPATWVAQFATRHMARSGLSREQLAQIALTAHANAARNPRALVREPLSMEKYLSSRMISSPLCLYDCDRYLDGSTVLIVSAGDALNEVQCAPVRIAASAGAVDRYSWDQEHGFSCFSTGSALWDRCDYGPSDVDVAQLYDGFSFLALLWLEALGFCPRGEGGAFIEGGQNIALNGALPINTGGGQLGGGRLHGFGFAHEAVVQLRGLGGERQVAAQPRRVVATSGGGPDSTAILFTRD